MRKEGTRLFKRNGVADTRYIALSVKLSSFITGDANIAELIGQLEYNFLKQGISVRKTLIALFKPGNSDL